MGGRDTRRAAMHCSDVRGFNYDGSWGSSGLDLWQHHDNGTMAVEIARGKGYFPGWNVARWWLSEEAFQRDSQRFLANFAAGLAIFADQDILVLPVLFNRWRDPVCDFGGVCLEHIVPGLSNMSGEGEMFAVANIGSHDAGRQIPLIEAKHRAYLEAIVGAHANDPRIFGWDLCNEPLMGPYAFDPANAARNGELRWLTWCYQKVKQIGAVQPLTVGSWADLQVQALVEPLSDFISIHPYYTWNLPHETTARFESFLDGAVALAQRAGKEIVASETAWGALDDAKRVEVLRYSLAQLRQRDIGFIVHALQHSPVSDLHRPAYGPVGVAGYMACVEPDGSLRPGHEAFNEFA
jgi:hypothetical protein